MNNMTRKFGIELEYSSSNVDYERLMTAFTESIREIDPTQNVTTRETFRSWTLKGDSSCGHEITSPALATTRENLDKVKAIVDSLRSKIRGSNIVRRTCGFHVHFDIGEFTTEQIRNLVRIFYVFEDTLLKLHPPSRTGNNFCRTFHQQNQNPAWINNFNPDEGDYNQDYFVFDHFTGLNFGRFNSRGTIEIRYGASTVRGIKVVNWIKTLLMLVEISKTVQNIPNRTSSISDLILFINNNNTGVDWLDRDKRRVSRWINNRSEEIRNPRERSERNTTRRNGSARSNSRRTGFAVPRIDEE